MANVNGERIKQARELRGLTQAQLADRAHVDQSTIAYLEKGNREPLDETLEAIAIQTGFPPSFFRKKSGDGFPSGSLQFRARTMSAGQRTQVRQYAKTVWEIAQHMAEQVSEIPLRLPKLSEQPEVAAAVTRSELGLSPDGPISHVTNTLEKAGVLVLNIPLPMDRWDAFCAWVGEDTKKPVIVVADGAPGDRLRYSIAHETGHLVLHQSLDGRLRAIDSEADRFASEFLMPESAMREELTSPVTLASLADLKPRWGVSIQALIRRAYSLEVITERQYKYLFQQLTKRGWRKQEPSALAVPIERPRAFRKMAELLYGDPIRYKQFAAEASITTQFANELIELHAARKKRSTERAQQASEADNLLSFPERRQA
jgi:Zn-dependent peptidase ImmA (M78 family)/DNA-binding XRE family transcriptional regulator